MKAGALAGKVALITGGGTGIGRATALRFAGDGASLAVNYAASRQEAEQTVSDLRSLGVRAMPVQADVADDEAVCRMFTAVAEELGPVDVLVCSAGRTRYIPFPRLDLITDSIWDELFAVNVKGALHCARAAAAQMKERGGVILFVASSAGQTGKGSSIPYAASKGALITLTKSLALALAPRIRVNAVAPGVVVSRWTEGHEEHKAKAVAETPLGRIGSVNDVAEVLLSLAVTSGFVTGQTVMIDGGRSL
jgi:3-oxoacyl-[acyl-carrier protein] reductase